MVLKGEDETLSSPVELVVYAPLLRAEASKYVVELVFADDQGVVSALDFAVEGLHGNAVLAD